MTGVAADASPQSRVVFEYRPAIDGLRALAVVAVIVYHIDSSWLPGGYLGVDIFFVLSGYLITTLLILEHRTSRTVDVAAFWGRRLRRLLPASLLMTLGVAAYWGVRADEVQRAGLAGDLTAVLLYVANWRFVTEGQSYFDVFSDVSPVRHAWSLAVEEQFYVVWPIVVLVALKRLTRTKALVLAVIGTVFSAVLMAVWFDPVDPSRVYYGTDTRVHQMAVGALLGATLLGPRRSAIVRTCGSLALPAAAVLGVMVVALPDTSAWYYRGGAVLAATCVACILASFEQDRVLTRVFAARWAVAVGTLSYGLYLWHWPVLMAFELEGRRTSTVSVAVLAVIVTAAIALASFFLVEQPVRTPHPRLRPIVSTRWLAVAAPLSVLAVLVFVLGTARSDQPAWAQLDASSVENVVGTGQDAAADGPVIGLVGDSVAFSIAGGLDAASSELGYQLFVAAVPACPVGTAPLYTAEGRPSPYADHCAETVGPLQEYLVELRPEIVVWHDLQSSQPRVSQDGMLLVPGSQEWLDDLLADWQETLDRLIAGRATVVIVKPPLRGPWPADDCWDSAADRCLIIQAEDHAVRAATEIFVDRNQPAKPVRLVSIDDLVCPSGRPCPTTIDDVTIRVTGRDQTHFTLDGAEWLGAKLLDRVLEASIE